MKSTSALAMRRFAQAGPTRFGVTRAVKNRYVQLMRDGNSMAKACQMMNVSYATITNWRRADPVFDRQIEEAKG